MSPSARKTRSSIVPRCRTRSSDRTIRVDVFLGGAPQLEPKVGEGLLEFGRHHPDWRFTIRGANFRYRVPWLRDQGVAGVLVLIEASSVAYTLERAGVPWVHLFPERPMSHPCVVADELAIGRLGADYLMGQGFLRCAFCGVGTVWSEWRAEGFRERLEASGRSCTFVNIPFAQDQDWGLTDGATRWLRRWVAKLRPGIAVMAAHDVLANRLVDACLQRGLRVPQDVAILGVGNHDMLCQLSPVPISSVDADVPLATVRAASMLEALMEGRSTGSPLLVPPRGVIERRSTEIVAYGDDIVTRAIQHIHDHASEGVNVRDLLRVFPVARRTLSRRFARFVGHSPAAEIRRVRLLHARHLVENSRLSLTEIAVNSGYADLSHMNRAFHQAIGVSPGALRKPGLRRVTTM